MTSVPAPLADLESAPRGDAPTDRPPGRERRHRYSLVAPSPALAKAGTRAGRVAGPALAVTYLSLLVLLPVAALFTINDFGGWTAINKKFFDPQTGLVAKDEQSLGVSTASG